MFIWHIHSHTQYNVQWHSYYASSRINYQIEEIEYNKIKVKKGKVKIGSKGKIKQKSFLQKKKNVHKKQ